MARSTPTRSRAAVTPAHARAAAQLAAQPDRPRARRATSSSAVAAVCVEHDLIAITDEVYEHLVFDGEHVPLATLPGMAERTLTISSLGKTFSVTGWKIGWASGPAELVAAVRGVKQFLTFAGGTPLQHAAAAALGCRDEHRRALRDELARQARPAGGGLDRGRAARSCRPAGTYFVNADVRRSATTTRRVLPRAARASRRRRDPDVASFCDDADAARSLVRFAFCKRDEVIDEAIARLLAWSRSP